MLLFLLSCFSVILCRPPCKVNMFSILFYSFCIFPNAFVFVIMFFCNSLNTQYLLLTILQTKRIFCTYNNIRISLCFFKGKQTHDV